MTASFGDPHIGLIAEGLGDVRAVPVVLRNSLWGQGDFRDLIGKPIPCNGRDRATSVGGLEGRVATAAIRPGCVGVLIVLDAEHDPACELGPGLLARARSVTDTPVSVTLAIPKFEAWLVASAETLGLPSLSFDPRHDPVHLIDQALRADLGEKYTKPVWQPRLAARVDLSLAAPRSPSLDRLRRKFSDLLREVP